MSTTIKTFLVRAFRSVQDAFAEMNHAQRRLFELRTQLPLDYRTLDEIDRLEASLRLTPRV